MYTQNKAILKYLLEGNTLTSREAMLEFGCMRLASRINDLRNDGHNIKSERIKVRNRAGKLVSVAQYSMEVE